MPEFTLYQVHPQRSVSRHGAKMRIPDYLDTRWGRVALRPDHIFHNRPIRRFQTWDEFLAWEAVVPPPTKPAVLTVLGDIAPKSVQAMTEIELGQLLADAPVAAAQDLVTKVGKQDGQLNAVNIGLAGVLIACALAIILIIVIAAGAWFSRGDDAIPPAPPPPATAGTPWDFPQPDPADAAPDIPPPLPPQGGAPGGP